MQETEHDEEHYLEPEPAVTLFDFFHLALVMAIGPILGISAASIVYLWLAPINNLLGILCALLIFIIIFILVFLAIGMLMAAFVLFLYRRYSSQCRIGYEATCYVLTHFNIPDENTEVEAKDSIKLQN